MDLEVLRTKIDEIDASLIKLLEERLNIAKEIGEYKKEKGLPVADYDRELIKLDSIEKASSAEFSEYNRMVFTGIMAVSKDLQGKIVEGEDAL